MDTTSDFHLSKDDEKCPAVSSEAVTDDDTVRVACTVSDDSANSCQQQEQQQYNDLHFNVLSSIASSPPHLIGSNVIGCEELSESQTSGVLIHYLSGHDTKYGAPKACSTGFSFFQPEIIDTVNSFVPNEVTLRDTAHSNSRLSEGTMSDISQYPVGDCPSSQDSHSEHSASPPTLEVEGSNMHSRNETLRLARCSHEQDHSTTKKNVRELSLTQYPLDFERSGSSVFSQFPLSDDSSRLVRGFDSLVQSSSNNAIKASQLTIVDTFLSAAEQTSDLPKFSVVDTYVGNNKAAEKFKGGNVKHDEECPAVLGEVVTDDDTLHVACTVSGDSANSCQPQQQQQEWQQQYNDLHFNILSSIASVLPQFTIVDTFRDSSVPGHFSREQADGLPQFEVVDAVFGNMAASSERIEDDFPDFRNPQKTTLSVEGKNFPSTTLATELTQNVMGQKVHASAGSADEKELVIGIVSESAVNAKSQQISAATSASLIATPVSLKLESGSLHQVAVTSVPEPATSNGLLQVAFTSDDRLMTSHVSEMPVASGLSPNGTKDEKSVRNYPVVVQSANVGTQDAQLLTLDHRLQPAIKSGFNSTAKFESGLPEDPNLVGRQKIYTWMPLKFCDENSDSEEINLMSSRRTSLDFSYAKKANDNLTSLSSVQWIPLQATEIQVPEELICPLSSSIVDFPFQGKHAESSICLSLNSMRVSIGDTLVHTERAPLGSSTPIAKEERQAVQKLQALQTIKDSEERSDSGRASRASTLGSLEIDLEIDKTNTKLGGSGLGNISSEERLHKADGLLQSCTDEDGKQYLRNSSDNEKLTTQQKKVISDVTEEEVARCTWQNIHGSIVGKPNSESSSGVQNASDNGEHVMLKRRELERLERLSRGSITASCSSLADSAIDFKASNDPTNVDEKTFYVTDQSESSDDLKGMPQRQEPIGQEMGDSFKKPGMQVVSARSWVPVGSRSDDNPQDSCSEVSDSSDVEKIRKLYISCVSDGKTEEKEENKDEEERVKEQEDEEEEVDDEEEEAVMQELGKKEAEKLEEENWKKEEKREDKSWSKNFDRILRGTKTLNKPNIGEFEGKPSSKNVHQIAKDSQEPETIVSRSSLQEISDVENAIVISDSDSVGSSLPRSGFSGSDVEDGLSEDVKRILVKYGRRFSDLRSSEAYKSDIKASNNQQCSDHLSTTDKNALGKYGANGENEKIQLAAMLKKQDGHSFDLSEASSDDTLGKRVSELLVKTGKTLGLGDKPLEAALLKSFSSHSSVVSSRTGSVDYDTLQKDLNELEMSLESIKKSELGNAFSGATEWVASNVNPMQNPIDPEAGAHRMGSRSLHYLLSSGIVPVNLALDIVHGWTDNSSSDGEAKVLYNDVNQLGTSRVTEVEPVHKDTGGQHVLGKASLHDEEGGIEFEESQHQNASMMFDTTADPKTGSIVSLSCKNKPNTTKEEEMENLVCSRISLLPEFPFVDDHIDRSKSQGSFLENVTAKRGSPHRGSSFGDFLEARLHGKIQASIPFCKGSDLLQKSKEMQFMTDTERGFESRNVGLNFADRREHQSSSGYSGSGSLPRSEASVNLKIGGTDKMAGSSEVIMGTGQLPKRTENDSSVGNSLVHGNFYLESKNQADMKRNQPIKENIDHRSPGRSSVRQEGLESDDINKNENRKSGQKFSVVSGFEECFDRDLQVVDYHISSSVPPGPVNRNSVKSEIDSKLQLRTNVLRKEFLMKENASEVDSAKVNVDHLRSGHFSHLEGFAGHDFCERIPIADEVSLKSKPVADVNKLKSFRNILPISDLNLRHGKDTVESSDSEGLEVKGTEQSDMHDDHYHGEVMLDNGDGQLVLDGANKSNGQLSVSPKHSPFQVSKSVCLLFKSQLDKIMMSNFDQSLDKGPARYPVVCDMASLEQDSNSSLDFDASGDSSKTFVVNDSQATNAADETLMPARRSSQLDDHSDHDLQSVSQEDPGSSNAGLRTSFTTVTSLHDSTDCESNLVFDYPVTNGIRLSSAALPAVVPYKPMNSRDVYYVDSGAEDGSQSAEISDATVESTHPGSDDAKAPIFPQHLLGSRSDAPMDVMTQKKMQTLPVSNSKPTYLSDSITEKSEDGNCVVSDMNYSMEKSRRMEIQQSQEKTKAWVCDVSLPDMCTPMKAEKENLTSFSDSNIPSGSKTVWPNLHSGAGNSKPLTRQLTQQGDMKRIDGDTMNASNTVADDFGFDSNSQVNETVCELLNHSTVKEKAKISIYMQSVPLVYSSDNRSQTLEMGLSGKDENCSISDCKTIPNSENCDDTIQPELRIMHIEKCRRKDKKAETHDQQLALDPKYDFSEVPGGALDHFVSERFTTRFESHYGMTPGIQAVVEKYTEKKDAGRKEMEDCLSGDCTLEEDLVHNVASEGLTWTPKQEKQNLEKVELFQSKAVDSSTQEMLHEESGLEQLQRSKSVHLSGHASDNKRPVENSANILYSETKSSCDRFDYQLCGRFEESEGSSSFESESSDRRAHASTMRLLSLVKNPAQHIIMHMQSQKEESRTDGGSTGLALSRSHSRADDGNPLLRSAESCRTFIVEATRPRELAQESTSSPGGQSAHGSSSNQGSRNNGKHTGDMKGRRNHANGRSLSAGAGDRSSSDDEQAGRRNNLEWRVVGKTCHLKKSLDEDEQQRRHEGRIIYESTQPKNVSKRAWIIQEDTLPAVPEDTTIDSVASEVTSGITDDGRKFLVSTDRCHLPNDPKLLKLQQRIAHQKEKYRRAYAREHQRKKKIAQLEAQYRIEAGIEASSVGSSLESFSQPPSEGSNSIPVASASSETSALCLSCSEMDGNTCVCVRLKSKHPYPKPLLPEEVIHGGTGTSPTRKQIRESAAAVSLHLREVNYSEEGYKRSKSATQTKRPHVGHAKVVHSKAASEKRSPRKNMEKKMPFSATSAKLPLETSKEGTATEKGTRTIVTPRDNTSISVERKSKSHMADFGMTFPPPHQELEKCSKGVQTTPRNEDQPLRWPYRGSRPCDVGVISIPVTGKIKVKTTCRNLHIHANAASEGDTHTLNKKTEAKMKMHQTKPRKPLPRGISWFIPIVEPNSSENYRGVCSELLANRLITPDESSKEDMTYFQRKSTVIKKTAADSDSMTTAYDRDAAILGKSASNNRNSDSTKVFPNFSNEFLVAKGDFIGPSLQESFRARMQVFIFRSQERERRVALRAERRIQELHKKQQHLQLLSSISKGSNVLRSDPVCEQLFKPRKRWFTKQQMKTMTYRRYRNLPEVMKIVEEKQKSEQFRANRQRVQMFKQKILTHILGEKNKRTSA